MAGSTQFQWFDQETHPYGNEPGKQYKNRTKTFKVLKKNKHMNSHQYLCLQSRLWLCNCISILYIFFNKFLHTASYQKRISKIFPQNAHTHIIYIYIFKCPNPKIWVFQICGLKLINSLFQFKGCLRLIACSINYSINWSNT